MEIGAITSIFRNSGLRMPEIIKNMAETGVNFIDINDNPDLLTADDKRELVRYIYKHEVDIRSVFALYDLCLVDPQVSEEVLISLKRRADFAVWVGARYVLTGVGRVPAGDDRQKGWNASVATVKRFADHCGKLGLIVAVELEPYDSSLVNDADSMLEYLKAVDSPHCRANLDVAHCVLRKIGPDQVKKLQACLVHVHLADCDGRTHDEWVPGTGNVPFKQYIDAIKQIDFNGGMALEVRPTPNPKEDTAKGLAYIRNLLK